MYTLSIENTARMPYLKKYIYILPVSQYTMGRDSSVGIATRYGLDGPGIESRWGQRFPAPVQTDPGPHLASCIGSFPGVKRTGRGADHPTHLSAEVMKG